MAKITCTLSAKVDKQTGKSEILLRMQNRKMGNRRAHSRIWILPQFMNETKGEIEIKARKLTPDVKEAYVQKGKLDKLKNHLVIMEQSTDGALMTETWFQDTIDRFMFPEQYEAKVKKEKESFFTVFQRFLDTKNFAKARAKHYQVLLRLMARWELYRGKTLELDTLQSADLNEFRDFLRNEHKLFRTDKDGKRHPIAKYAKLYDLVPESRYPVERGENHINGIMKMFRAFYNWCLDQEITANDPFRRFAIGSQIYGTPVYISIEERDQIADADMGGNKHLETQRDIFIFQCFIGCRVSDLYSMTVDNILTDKRGTYIEYVPTKTKDENPNIVKVYLADRALALVSKYNSQDRKKLFPFIAQQNYNDAIKAVFHKAGIERMVTVRNPVTGKNEQKCIADVASSHLARRTFVGNLYKQVKDPNLVGKLSGHKEGSRAFARYRDIDDDMVREMTNLLG